MDIRRRMWLYLALLGLALATMFLLNRYALSPNEVEDTQAHNYDYSGVRSRGELRVLAPYSLMQEDEASPNNLQKLIAKLHARSGLEIRLRLEDNTHKALESLADGSVDLVLHSVAHTAQIDSTLFVWLHESVSDPIYLVQRQDTATLVRKQLELEHKTITLPKGSPLRLFVEHLADEMALELHTVEDSLYNTEQLITKVQATSIDYTLCSGEEAQRYRKHFPKLNFDLPISHNLRRGYLARRSSPQLVDSMRLWLR